ncbi:DUF397 domain-containing protein [Streptomyces xanthophaeus]|uniref:DUF397 domain-containing protein n=1 Tax=Streptomyces xanthophaeus TaxID=67385 RepID=UPI0004CD2301|nr:DUF397 domain-containing protein [Streptomyces xanthophaeus]
MTTEFPRWFKSSYSENGGACIEVATNLVAARGVVPVRDSKRDDSPVLGFTAAAFATFVDGIKAV